MNADGTGGALCGGAWPDLADADQAVSQQGHSILRLCIHSQAEDADSSPCQAVCAAEAPAHEGCESQSNEGK